MKSKSKTLAVGVTGGIGSGKTEVCQCFALLGAKVIYADEIAKEIIADDASVRKNIQKEFGAEMFLSNGTLDRRRMATLVFTDRNLKEKLDAIVHPATLKRIDIEIRRAKDTAKYPIVVVEAALIFESGADKMLDYVVMVEANEEIAIERVMKRDAMSSDDVKRRMQSQMPVVEKSKKADFILHNSSDIASLERNCRFLFSLLTKMALKED